MDETFLIGGVSLIVLVFGLVEFLKKTGLAGIWLTVASLVLGIIFGLAYRIVQSGMPVTIPDWITIVIYGLVVGLTASGVYDFFDKRFPG